MLVINCAFEFHHILGCNAVISNCSSNKLPNHLKISITNLLITHLYWKLARDACTETVFRTRSPWAKRTKGLEYLIKGKHYEELTDDASGVSIVNSAKLARIASNPFITSWEDRILPYKSEIRTEVNSRWAALWSRALLMAISKIWDNSTLTSNSLIVLYKNIILKIVNPSLCNWNYRKAGWFLFFFSYLQ